MPFVKRTVQPQLLCRLEAPRGSETPEPGGSEDLVSVSNLALTRVLLQLSDLARLSCSLFTELESELRGGAERILRLQGRVLRLQDRVSELDPRQEPVRKYPNFLRPLVGRGTSAPPSL
ncbi:hypothetical protein PBY51_018313 [Eleginops maclovinus]|uniref:Uncharacterized protein n=1 Tax=Eleginops maclovinus TaxID=56733 RepID=A0AAN7Y707_ELEMC|nr:hypothetical protein PBY51_018313 [Eleginops maclovinus]